MGGLHTLNRRKERNWPFFNFPFQNSVRNLYNDDKYEGVWFPHSELTCHPTVNPAIFHTRHETFTPPFHHIFLGLRLQILNSITHFQFSKWNKQYRWDKNSLGQKNIDFRGCECYMPCVKDGWIDGMRYEIIKNSLDQKNIDFWGCKCSIQFNSIQNI